MPSMNRVPHIKSSDPSLKGFIGNVNSDIDKLNKLIEAYNSTVEQDASIAQLKEILRFKQLIENKYSDNHVNKCLEFSSEIQVKLFAEIQTEFAKYGVTNLYGILSKTPPPPLPPHNFSEILINMDTKKVNQLMAILSDGPAFSLHQLKNLYKPSEAGYAAFNSFLKNNSISYLGGGNSKNFKITPTDGSPPYVLKVENRMGMPKLPVDHLREKSLKDTLTPVMAERQSTSTEKGVNMTRTILTTEFCAGGDLMAHSQNFGDDLQRSKAALNTYNQMLDILIGISKDGCAFPDMKNTNWLIDPSGKVMLADTKSFIFCEADGTIDYTKTTEVTGGSFTQTTYLNPPEFYSELAVGIPISADKMHAFMLGKNLYQYLTCCDDSYLQGKTSISLLKHKNLKSNKYQALKDGNTLLHHLATHSFDKLIASNTDSF